jgi:hypothetical protein
MPMIFVFASQMSVVQALLHNVKPRCVEGPSSLIALRPKLANRSYKAVMHQGSRESVQRMPDRQKESAQARA